MFSAFPAAPEGTDDSDADKSEASSAPERETVPGGVSPAKTRSPPDASPSSDAKRMTRRFPNEPIANLANAITIATSVTYAPPSANTLPATTPRSDAAAQRVPLAAQKSASPNGYVP